MRLNLLPGTPSPSIVKASDYSGNGSANTQSKHHHGVAFSFLIAIVRKEQINLQGHTFVFIVINPRQ